MDGDSFARIEEQIDAGRDARASSTSAPGELWRGRERDLTEHGARRTGWASTEAARQSWE